MDALITAVVHTRNEERSIARCLRSLGWCDRLLVADMGSTDRTRAIAEELGAEVISVPEYGFVEPAYADAMAAVTTTWVMRIDADEVVPPSLAVALRQVADDDLADVVVGSRLNFMVGEKLRGTGWGLTSDRQTFFFKPSHLVHPAQIAIHHVFQPVDGARVRQLAASEDLAVWHFAYSDWSHFVAKLDRYSSVEAEAAHGSARSPFRAVRNALEELAWRGARHRSWRDGYRGLVLLWMQMTYRVLVFAKRRERESWADRRAIEAHYDRIADDLQSGRTPR